MSYKIKTTVKNCNYWIRYDESDKSPWKTGIPEGLRDNGTSFKTLVEAETMLHLSKHHIKTNLEVDNVK